MVGSVDGGFDFNLSKKIFLGAGVLWKGKGR
jgi:hypothetical protein